jgi:16S rRNA (cytidine1402-2'-O)-methyltransferase
VPLVAAEDTRLTRRLFARYEIATSLVSYHAQSGRGREVELLEHLRSGRDLALVTDAGTPLVSDPGASCVRLGGRGRRRRPDPGGVGRAGGAGRERPGRGPLDLRGLPAASGKERASAWPGSRPTSGPASSTRPRPEFPATLADLAAAAGGERRAAVCRELTKIHEEVVRGPLGELRWHGWLPAGSSAPKRRGACRRRRVSIGRSCTDPIEWPRPFGLRRRPGRAGRWRKGCRKDAFRISCLV